MGGPARHVDRPVYSSGLIYNHINNHSNAGRTAARRAKNGAGLVRWIAHRWDLVGALALLGSSAAYGVFALAHLA